MENFYQICKSFTDPVFAVFSLLLVSLVFCFTGSRKKTGVLILSFAVLFLYGLSIAPVANYLAYWLEKDYFRERVVKKPIDVVVVLAGGANDISALNISVASETSIARLHHGVGVFNKYGAKYLVCAGKGDAIIPEGELMAKLALTAGVPKEKVRIDAKSNNTWEHAVELNKMFADKNISLAIVTSGYHMKRAEKVFKKYFRNVMPFTVSCLYNSSRNNKALKYIPQTAALSITATTLRELIGSIWYEIKGI